MEKSNLHLKTTATITGLSSELHVISELIYLGISVFQALDPYSGNDIVIEINGKLLGVQVKTMIWREREMHYRVHPQHKGREGYKGIIDIYIFYCREENVYFIIPYNDVKGIGEITWRPQKINTKRGGQPKKIDLNIYCNNWEIIFKTAGCSISDWQKERLAKINIERGAT